MDHLCLHCGEQLGSPWLFCAHCGTPIEQEKAPRATKPETEPAPVTGALSGLLFGLIAVPLLLIVGVMLCLTGLGAFLGVPMIVAAILAPLAGPLFGMGAARGKVL